MSSVSQVCNSNALKWAKSQFKDCLNTDIRRINRVIDFASKVASSPETSIPKLAKSPYDCKAYYNLFKHPQSNPEYLQMGHRKNVLEQLHEPGEYLLIEDTSDIVMNQKEPIDGLGPVGNGKRQGFLLHSMLAVKWTPTVLDINTRRPSLPIVGLAHQQYHIRQAAPVVNGVKQYSRELYGRKKVESDLWRNFRERLAPPPSSPEVKWTRICDRGSDIFDVIKESADYGFIIRACHNRCVNARDKNGNEVSVKLLEHEESADLIGRFELKLKERNACVEVRTANVQLKAPSYSKGNLSESVTCNVIYASEVDVERKDAVKWVLLTDELILDLATAMSVIQKYACRWMIEEYHKALKSGTRAEKLQLESAQSLFAAISILSVVAVRLLDLKERVHLNENGDVSEAGLSDLEIRILQNHCGKEFKIARDVYLAIGRLGGHLNRKSDGMPGMITLWRGMSDLLKMKEGVIALLGNNVENLNCQLLGKG